MELSSLADFLIGVERERGREGEGQLGKQRG